MNKAIVILILVLLTSSSVWANTTCFDLLDEQSQEFVSQDPETLNAIEGTELGEPLFVKEIVQGRDYYLVPCNKETGATAVVVVDAEQGYFRELTILYQPIKYLPVNKQDMLAMINELVQPNSIENPKVEFVYDVNKELQWQAGQYSQSPFTPFWVVEIENGQWIVDQEGNIYQLTEFASAKLDTVVEEVETDLLLAEKFKTMGKYYEVSNPSLENETFEVELTFSYQDENQDGIVDGTEIDEEKINVYYFAEQQEWIEIPIGKRNTEANTIMVKVNHFTMFALMEEIPPAQPKPPAQNPTDGGAPLGRVSGGGGATPDLSLSVEGNCAKKEIIITVLNIYGNPSKEATVYIMQDVILINEIKTDDDGKASFMVETGKYTIKAVKGLSNSYSQDLNVVECTEALVETGNKTVGNICSNIDCDDNNPCTSEYCVAETEHCNYNNQENGIQCSLKGTCQEGICTEPENKTETGPMGFFGLAKENFLKFNILNKWFATSIVLAALIAIGTTSVVLRINKKMKK